MTSQAPPAGRALPKVSVVVPAYNQRWLIEETLQSILDQDYPAREIIVSDDFSTDGTREWLMEFAAGRKDVILLLQPWNLGISGNTNACLSACTGKYVAFFSGDDVMLPGKLRLQVAALEVLESQRYVACVSAAAYFDTHTGETLWVQNPVSRGASQTFDARDLIASANRLFIESTWMFRADALPAGLNDRRLPRAGDFPLLVEIALKGRISALPETLVRYRIHEGQATATGYLEDTMMAFALIEARYPHLYNAVRRGRATELASLARGHLSLRQRDVARLRAVAALQLSPSISTLGLFFLSFAPWPLVSAVKRIYQRLVGRTDITSVRERMSRDREAVTNGAGRRP